MLTIDGKAELVIQGVASYQRLRQIDEDAQVLESIRRGLEDMDAGRTISLSQWKEHARGRRGIKG